MANYSIIKTICELIKERDEIQGKTKGESTQFVKVASHKIDNEEGMTETEREAITAEQKINKIADELADRGVEGSVIIRLPYHNLAPAVLRDKGIVEESGVYGLVMKAMDKVALREDIATSKSARYEVTAMTGTWKAASDITAQDVRSSEELVFIFRLRGRCLPTPKQIQLLNFHLIHQLYPGFMCPMCMMCHGNEFHIICQCSLLREVRNNAMEMFFDDIHKVMKSVPRTVGQLEPRLTIESKEAMRKSLFPGWHYEFKLGATPDVVRQEMNKSMRHNDKQC